MHLRAQLLAIIGPSSASWPGQLANSLLGGGHNHSLGRAWASYSPINGEYSALTRAQERDYDPYESNNRNFSAIQTSNERIQSAQFVSLWALSYDYALSYGIFPWKIVDRWSFFKFDPDGRSLFRPAVFLAGPLIRQWIVRINWSLDADRTK